MPSSAHFSPPTHIRLIAGVEDLPCRVPALHQRAPHTEQRLSPQSVFPPHPPSRSLGLGLPRSVCGPTRQTLADFQGPRPPPHRLGGGQPRHGAGHRLRGHTKHRAQDPHALRSATRLHGVNLPSISRMTVPSVFQKPYFSPMVSPEQHNRISQPSSQQCVAETSLYTSLTGNPTFLETHTSCPLCRLQRPRS